MDSNRKYVDDLKAYLNSLNDGDNITVTCDLLSAIEGSLNYISELENKNENAFMVKFVWSTDDDEGSEVELFENYDDAVKRFNEIIKNEKNPNYSWVANAFDENTFDDKNYELDYKLGKEFMYWSVSKRDDGNFYSTIILSKECVK